MNLDSLTRWPQLPIQERVLDRLADMLFASDEILDMLRRDQRRSGESTVDIELSVRRVYNEINELMKQLAD